MSFLRGVILSAVCLLCLSLFSCATQLSSRAMHVIPVEESTVKNCVYLGEVGGSSGLGNGMAAVGIHNSKNEARDLAAEMGGTNIVWVRINGFMSSFVRGRVYDCNKK